MQDEDGDLVETDVEDEELRKRLLSPSGAGAEETKKPRIDPPVDPSTVGPPIITVSGIG